MSRISSDAILNKLRNRLSGPTLPIIPCILGPFKVHHALCDWGASMNILPKFVYDCLDEDPLVPTPHQLRLAESVMMQSYGIAKDVLIEFQDSSTLVDFMRGYESSLAYLHHPREVLPKVSQSNH
jgi:hypothetical protein